MMKKLSVCMSLFLVFGLGGTGCKKLLKKAQEKAAESASNAASGSSSTPSSSPTPSGSAAKKSRGGSGYFEDAVAISTKFNAFFANAAVRPLEMVVYPEFVKAQIQDPKTPLNVDGYELRGDVERTGPVKFMGKAPSAKDLEKATFDLKDVDFAKLPQMIKEAPEKCEVPDGKVTHLMIKRPLPFSNKTSIRVYVTGERRDGNMEYNLDGTVRKIYN